MTETCSNRNVLLFSIVRFYCFDARYSARHRNVFIYCIYSVVVVYKETLLTWQNKTNAYFIQWIFRKKAANKRAARTASKEKDWLPYWINKRFKFSGSTLIDIGAWNGAHLLKHLSIVWWMHFSWYCCNWTDEIVISKIRYFLSRLPSSQRPFESNRTTFPVIDR